MLAQQLSIVFNNVRHFQDDAVRDGELSEHEGVPKECTHLFVSTGQSRWMRYAGCVNNVGPERISWGQ